MMEHPLIIGITGPIGHGKTTFAEALAEIEPSVRHFETSAIIAEVANAWHARLGGPSDLLDIEKWLQHLPGVLHDVLALECRYQQIKPDPEGLQSGAAEYTKLLVHIANLQQNFELAQIPITGENKEIYRPILQWLGGYLVQRIDQKIWYKEIIRRIQQCDPERVRLCTVGGLRFPSDAETLREVNGIIVQVYRPNFGHTDLLDPTERDRDGIIVDTTVVNEGTEADLRTIAARLLVDIQHKQIRPTYRP